MIVFALALKLQKTMAKEVKDEPASPFPPSGMGKKAHKYSVATSISRVILFLVFARPDAGDAEV
jgi:hypothetical protein